MAKKKKTDELFKSPLPSIKLKASHLIWFQQDENHLKQRIFDY